LKLDVVGMWGALGLGQGLVGIVFGSVLLVKGVPAICEMGCLRTLHMQHHHVGGR
jgi:hypothetical protein